MFSNFVQKIYAISIYRVLGIFQTSIRQPTHILYRRFDLF